MISSGLADISLENENEIFKEKLALSKLMLKYLKIIN